VIHGKKSSPPQANLAEHAAAIRQSGKQTVDENVAAPTDLTDERLETIAKNIETLTATTTLQVAAQIAEAHEIFRYRRDEGGFGGWVETRLGYSRQTAYNLLNVHEQFGGQESVQSLDTLLTASVLYLLAAPSTPTEARDEIIERVKAGEPVSVAKVKNVVDAAKGMQSARKRSPRNMRRLGIIRAEKLGPDVIAKIKGTSLGRADEQNALIELNRGALEGENTDIVKKFAAAAAAGEQLSAVKYIKIGAAFRGEDIGAGRTSEADPPPPSDDGPDSASEAERLRARNEELERENRRLMGENIALRSELKELKATGGDMSTGEFQTAIRKWEDTVETQKNIIAHLEKENAKLRAEAAAPLADDGLDLPGFLDRAKQTEITP
jgi:hypothetical protein